jgi:hypothetical protein
MSIAKNPVANEGENTGVLGTGIIDMLLPVFMSSFQQRGVEGMVSQRTDTVTPLKARYIENK